MNAPPYIDLRHNWIEAERNRRRCDGHLPNNADNYAVNDVGHYVGPDWLMDWSDPEVRHPYQIWLDNRNHINHKWRRPRLLWLSQHDRWGYA